MKGYRHFDRKDREFIRDHFMQMTNKQIGKAIGRTESSISFQLVKMKLRRDKHKKWTKEDITLLQKKYAEGMTLRQLMNVFNVSHESLKGVTQRFNIKSGRNGQIKKGNRPWNFRTKGVVKSTPGMASTQFKTGGLPGNTLHDGAITIRHDHPKTRKGRPYKWIRISKGKWIHYHRYLWEQQNGPVPAKHIVAFRDGNTMNTDISNLKLMTMADNAIRNYNKETSSLASKNLTDKYIAGRLSGGDKKLRKAIINGAPQLIELKRTQLKLKRQIKNERHQETRATAE